MSLAPIDMAFRRRSHAEWMSASPQRRPNGSCLCRESDTRNRVEQIVVVTDAQRRGSVRRPGGVVHRATRERDQVSAFVLQDRLGMMRIGDQADGHGRDPDLAPDARRIADMVPGHTRDQRSALSPWMPPDEHVDHVHAAPHEALPRGRVRIVHRPRAAFDRPRPRRERKAACPAGHAARTASVHYPARSASGVLETSRRIRRRAGLRSGDRNWCIR